MMNVNWEGQLVGLISLSAGGPSETLPLHGVCSGGGKERRRVKKLTEVASITPSCAKTSPT